MKRVVAVVLPVVLSLTLLAGCATVTFRRGAGPGDMRADEDACRATSTSEAAYAACLRERGWLVAGKAARAGKPAPAAPPATTAAAPAPAPKPAAEPPAATTKRAPAAPTAPAAGAGPATKPSGSAGATPASAPPTAAAPVVTAPVGEAAATAAAPEAEDPLTRIAVSSWWKLGGTAAELDRAMATCADKLGDAHRPAPGGTEVTIGMRDCLREAKWFPLGGSGWR